MATPNHHLHDSTPNWAVGSNMYFNSLHPALAAIHTGLAAFGFLVIVRFCIQYVRSWAGSVERSHSTGLHLEQQPNWQQQQQLRPPPQTTTWYPSEKQQTISGFPPMMKSTSNNISGAMPSPPESKMQTGQLGGNGLRRQFSNRVPLAPALTPPMLQTSERRINVDDFMKQPNPNYTSASPPPPPPPPPAAAAAAAAAGDISEASGVSSSAPRRRSYMKRLSVGIPADAAMQQQQHGADANASSEPIPAAQPNSYPASPQLSTAPANNGGAQTEPTTPTDPEQDQDQVQRSWPKKSRRSNIDLQGEVVSLVDSKGASWTRHTRVYGGGVCLACAASGTARHDQGGFYGATVPPEEMRQN